MVFQTQLNAMMPVRAERKFGETPPLNPPLKYQPVAGALVEVERYNATAPKELPPDEQVTRAVKTDPNGVATCTLTEAGWWAVTTQYATALREHEGKKYPVKRRATMWVFVDEKR